MTIPISAVLITKNAELHLAKVLAALTHCAEIVVLDCGSTDRTEAIARQAGARFEHQVFLGFGPQKNHAIALARNDWILSIDADEVLDDEAQRAITQLDLLDASRSWRIRRRTFVGSSELRHGHLNDAPVRLFNRTTAQFNQVPVHESVVTHGRELKLPGSIQHYSFIDAADLVARGAGYARHKATIYRSKGRRCAAPWLLVRACGAFLKSYVFKAGFLDGRLGVVAAFSAALNASTALAMASEQ
ncbi:MAG: glycosyltransferase family 2 protein [Planctomycetota bacterium]